MMNPADVQELQNKRTIEIEKTIKYILKAIDDQFEGVVRKAITQSLFTPQGGTVVLERLGVSKLAPDEEKLLRSAMAKMFESYGWKFNKDMEIYQDNDMFNKMSIHVELSAIPQ